MAWSRRLASGRWQACWRDPDGRVRTQTFDRKRDADDFAATTTADVLRGSYVDPAAGKEPLEAFWRRYREHPTRPLKPSTRARYDGLWRLYVSPALGRYPLGRIKRAHVEAMVSRALSESGSAWVARDALRLARMLLNQALAGERIGRNPAVRMQAPKAAPTEEGYLTPSEIERLVEAHPDRWRAFVALAAYGGLRFSELAGLRPGRVEFLRRRVRVEASIVEVSGHLHPGTPKSERARTVALPEFVMEALAEHIRRWPPGESGLVFSGARGGPVRRSNFYRVWHRALGRAELEPLAFKALRHTAAALAIAAGAHPKAIQDRLGHHSAAFTLDRYGHLFDSLDGELAGRLGEARAAGLLLARPSGGRRRPRDQRG